eukprot:3840535-Amphidinium_carterae.2
MALLSSNQVISIASSLSLDSRFDIEGPWSGQLFFVQETNKSVHFQCALEYPFWSRAWCGDQPWLRPGLRIRVITIVERQPSNHPKHNILLCTEAVSGTPHYPSTHEGCARRAETGN